MARPLTSAARGAASAAGLQFQQTCRRTGTRVPGYQRWAGRSGTARVTWCTLNLSTRDGTHLTTGSRHPILLADTVLVHGGAGRGGGAARRGAQPWTAWCRGALESPERQSKRRPQRPPRLGKYRGNSERIPKSHRPCGGLIIMQPIRRGGIQNFLRASPARLGGIARPSAGPQREGQKTT